MAKANGKSNGRCCRSIETALAIKQATKPMTITRDVARPLCTVRPRTIQQQHPHSLCPLSQLSCRISHGLVICCSRPTHCLLHICCVYPSSSPRCQSDLGDDRQPGGILHQAHNSTCLFGPSNTTAATRSCNCFLFARSPPTYNVPSTWDLPRAIKAYRILDRGAFLPLPPPKSTHTHLFQHNKKHRHQRSHRSSLICVVRQQQQDTHSHTRPSFVDTQSSALPGGTITLQFTLSLSPSLPKVVCAEPTTSNFY
ncbi:hypothetical protein BKA66DRAFT_110590 [Pyrenochaeta sp. MPI-SDFR-AT-0127]|nr:hypothetical protein BKA66DRAFT_110590 [Pyrenochaeta sp. MPI-SDFR-AT-0127]